jgi:hypothetical protein
LSRVPGMGLSQNAAYMQYMDEISVVYTIFCIYLLFCDSPIFYIHCFERDTLLENSLFPRFWNCDIIGKYRMI